MEAGERIVLYIVVATLSISAAVIAWTTLATGPEKLPVQLVRFALTVLLCVFLFRGASSARWIAIVLFALGGLGATVGGFAILRESAFGLLLLAMGAAYLMNFALLAFNSSVKAHFARGKPAA